MFVPTNKAFCTNMILSISSLYMFYWIQFQKLTPELISPWITYEYYARSRYDCSQSNPGALFGFALSQYEKNPGIDIKLRFTTGQRKTPGFKGRTFDGSGFIVSGRTWGGTLVISTFLTAPPPPPPTRPPPPLNIIWNKNDCYHCRIRPKHINDSKERLFIVTKTTRCKFSGKSPSSGHKTTLKQQLNG